MPIIRVLLVLSLCALRLDAKLTGAIFTTDVNGDKVNQNLYATKPDVYLNGGPKANGQCGGAAGLPDGDYVFQVTDPSGSTLLSSDSIANRHFTVSGGTGLITSASTHVTGTSQCTGGISVQLFPFNDTPNPGGEYKVWVTLFSNYDPVNQGNFGFDNADTKTDNFKVRNSIVATTGGPPPPAGCLNLFKIYDTNTNGQQDPNEIIINNWQFSVQSVATSQITYYSTPLIVNDLPFGDYIVCDSRPTQYFWVPTIALCSTVTLSNIECVNVMRGCVCVGGAAVAAHGANYWGGNPSLITSADLAALDALNLKTAAGTDFDPTTTAQLIAWGGAATTANPRYYLSVQLAVSTLNTRHGTDASTLVLGEGVAIADGFPSGFFPLSALQSLANSQAGSGTGDMLATASILLDANNNVIYVQPQPCPFSFPTVSKRSISTKSEFYVYPGQL